MSLDIIKSDLIQYFIIYKPQIFYLIETFVKIGILYGAVMTLAGVLTVGERKLSALMQDRVGPNRAYILGFTLWGLFHVVADGIKMIMKEDFMPKNANKILFTLAPIISLVPILFVFAFIPFGNYINIFGYTARFEIIDSNLSVFLIFAFSSLAVYGAFLAGFTSGNNWGLLGSIRAQAQMISYEVVMVLSILPVIMIYSSPSLSGIISAQGENISGFIPKWGIILQPLSFLIFFTAALVESKRAPFDVVEGESEIIGYFVEHSSMRFAGFMFGEYIEIVLFSMLISIFFFGGWQVPYLSDSGFTLGNISIPVNHYIKVILELLSISVKTVIFSCIFIFIRWTLPRFRYDHITKLCWNYLMPISVLNLVVTAFFVRAF